MISYLNFRDTLIPYGCFTIHQARSYFPKFNRNSLTRWEQKKLIIKLRQEWYSFPDMLNRADFSRYIASRIYCPSYISLHTALSIYGIIPEAVSTITSVTTLKTSRFENQFGQYSYQNIKPTLFFGYKPISTPKNNSMVNQTQQTWYIAYPEKALLDLLYLYPFYNNESELKELRLDEYFITNELDTNKLKEYQQKIGCKALDKRINLLLKVYGL